MRNEIKADFDRFCAIDGGGSAPSARAKLRIWFFGYGLQVLAAYRFFRWSLQGSSPLIRALKLPLAGLACLGHELAGRMYDIRISRHAEIGPGCHIGHFAGIRVGRCRIGRISNINHQVTIGDFPSGGAAEPVVIGNRVWIGAHSTIQAGARIGDGAVVSAGTTVSAEVPERAMVIGPSARVMNRDFDNSKLLGLQ